MTALLGNYIKANILKGYKTSLSHIARYAKSKYPSKDIDVWQLDYAFVSSYEFYLCSSINCTSISAANNIKHLREIIKICIAHKWITEDPFTYYQIKAKSKIKTFLTAYELLCIDQKSFPIPILAHVLDIFVFFCNTRLSYVDVKKLTSNDIAKEVDGKLWILTRKEKNRDYFSYPLT